MRYLGGVFLMWTTIFRAPLQFITAKFSAAFGGRNPALSRGGVLNTEGVLNRNCPDLWAAGLTCSGNEPATNMGIIILILTF